mmetsp:Transcript_78419/g.239890  ORF Transcript_78419/g.239890 Transcript_78419/m.239890 type:complete len:362 (+) Transcript_78419:1976-3061(+)
MHGECPASQHAGEAKDHYVAHGLDDMPKLEHGLTLHQHRPHLPGEHQRRHHGAEDAGYVANAFGHDEGPIGTRQGQTYLDDGAEVVQAVVGGPYPQVKQDPDTQAEDAGADGRLDGERQDARRAAVLAFNQPVCNREEHHRGAVVEQGLALDLHGEHRGRAQVLQQAHHGDGVGGREDRAHHQTRREVPAVRQQVIQHRGGGRRADDHARACKDQALEATPPSHVRVDRHGVAEQQGRQKREEQQVRVYGRPGLVAVHGRRRRLEGARLREQRQDDPDDEEDDRDRQRAQGVHRGRHVDHRRPDEQRSEHEVQRLVRMDLVGVVVVGDGGRLEVVLVDRLSTNYIGGVEVVLVGQVSAGSR